MRRLSALILILLVIGLAGGAVFLATWEIPPPSSTVEKVMPDDQFPR